MKPFLAVRLFGIPMSIQEAKFENCTFFQKSELEKWAESPLGFLLFVGGSGRGKSFAAVCCIRKFYETTGECDIKYANVPLLSLEWKKCINERTSELDLLNKYSERKLLVLDDLGQREPSPAFLDFLYILINERMNENIATIITTNFTSNALREKMGDAITSRLCTAKIFKFEGKDQRIMNF